ncbi:response regulator [Sediminibacterium sp.]|uniref:response regulator n=1 Tax=Sediminibacterium sp. TaxID=1917865 RepID=UPI00273300B2|nr:response regulator [Sediminibacterium sp.]MDP3392798.1 response regulator [Sediminibacterium sp.]MDP3565920.1 response regulator [Sediminibacterium sp.]
MEAQVSTFTVLPSFVSLSALLEAIYNKLPDMIFIFNVKERRFVLRNPALDDMLGFEHLKDQEINCISLRSLIHSEDWKPLQNAMQQLESLEKQNVEIECRCLDKFQQYQYFNARLSVFEKLGNEVVHLIGIAQNISERKKIEQQSQLFKNRLQELSFITSHEMRHEYAKIQSIVNLMDNKFISDTERVELIGEAKKSIQLINSSIFKLNHKLSFNQQDEFFNMNKEAEKFSKILMIDDDVLTNVLNRKIVQALMPEMPVEVYIDIDDALADIRNMGKMHQTLIFLDINFPGRGGWEFLDDYATISEASNVIVLSSSIDNRDREKARSYTSVIDYVTKPLSFDFVKSFFADLESAKLDNQL